MVKSFGVGLLLILLSGCANQALNESQINIAIENNDSRQLQRYKSNVYVTNGSLESPRPGFTEYSNAMEAAIYVRNIDAVDYLSSIGANNKVSVHYKKAYQWHRTLANIPAAELACGVGAFDIMALLLEKYPEDRPNYTNCLHYFISNYQYYPAQTPYHPLLEGRPFYREGGPSLRSWRTQAFDAQAVQKIINLGAEPNTLPSYGSAMYSTALVHPGNDVLRILLENGLDPNKEYPCLFPDNTSCRFITDVSRYSDENKAIARSRLLVKYGANLDAVFETPVIIGLNEHGQFQYELQSITALHMAKYFEYEHLAATFVELGANKSIMNKDGLTADQYHYRASSIITARQEFVRANAVKQQQEQPKKSSGGPSIMGITPSVIELLDVAL